MEGGGGGSGTPSAAFSAFSAVPRPGTVTLAGISTEVSYTSLTPTSPTSTISAPQNGTVSGAMTFNETGQANAVAMTGALSNVNFDKTSTFTTSGGLMSVASADNKNVMVLSDPSALVYNYQTFGFWETGSGTTSSRAAAISVGSATPASAVPTTGTATFQGLTLGGYVDPQGNAYTATSAATLNTNFSSRTISYSTSNTQKFDGSTGLQNAAANINLSGTLSYNSGTNSFTGAVTTTDGMTGTARGQFYGPSATEAGGTFGMTGGGVKTYVGAFGAKR